MKKKIITKHYIYNEDNKNKKPSEIIVYEDGQVKIVTEEKNLLLIGPKNQKNVFTNTKKYDRV